MGVRRGRTFGRTRKVAAQLAAQLPKSLSAQAELGYQGSVALDILAAKVIEQPTPLANHHEQPAAAVVIAFVEAKMLGQMVDSLGQQCHLHLGGPGVAFAMSELGNDLLCALHDAQNLK